MKSLRGLHLHLDPVSGIAGDMTVAALVDAGVPEAVVSDAIDAVGVPGLTVRFESRRRGAFVGRGFVARMAAAGKRPARGKISSRVTRGKHEHAHEHAHEHEHAHGHEHEHVVGRAAGAHHSHRDYADIRRLLKNAKFDPDAKALAEEMFARLAEVEAALHGTPVSRVAFHEVGAFDSIADIVGMSAAIAWLAPTSIGSSPPVVGTGTVRTAHGIVPVPAPATAALLQGLAVISEGEGELTTPTGAVFLATVVDSFGPPPPWRLAAIGYGAGTRVNTERPNVLRVMLGNPLGAPLPPAAEAVMVAETNIDDLSGQLLAALHEALFKAGALDVWSTAILMKKGRPAHKVSALVVPALLPAVERAFFLHSTTLGVRIYPVSRSTLARSIQQVATPFGAVSVKVGALDGQPINATPEYEDCRRRAAAAGVPVRMVWTAAIAASAGGVPWASPPAVIDAGPGARSRRKTRAS